MTSSSSSSPSPPPPSSSSQSTTGPNGKGEGNAQQGASTGAFQRRFPRLSATFAKYQSSRIGRVTATAWTRRRPIFIGLALTYGAVNYAVMRKDAYLRDYIHPDTWLVLKVYPGSIVEARSAPNLTALLSSPSAGEDAPRVLELFELMRALKWAQRDERIKGLFADFSGLHVPSSVNPEPLGLAQIEELVQAIHEFKLAKKEQHSLSFQQKNDQLSITASGDNDGPTPLEPTGAQDGREPQSDHKEVVLSGQVEEKAEKLPTTIAWADSFDSQGAYLLASAFDHVYLQPSGEVPLTGVTIQIPFVRRALEWLGVKMHAEARRDYKSMVSTFTESDSLTPAQLRDEAQLLGELGRGLAHSVGINRFPDMDPEAAADKVTELTRRGPFSAKEALDERLIDGVKYKREVVRQFGKEPHLRTLASYSKINDQVVDRKLSDDEKSEVAVVFLRGTISNAPGDFSASSCIRGLKEAAEDEDIKSIVLRIDSGGGDVVASDSIWDAVKRVQEDYNKPVIASFGNASASGGYYAAAGADAILACENTITGSIGVASLRPTITKSFFDRLGVQVQTIFTGSKQRSTLHDMDEEQRVRHSKHIDETYDTFLDKVCSGRKISRDIIEDLAGGRVWTGLSAWVRCNQDKELTVTTEESEAKCSKDKEERKSKKLVDWTPESGRVPIKVISLTSDWKTQDVTQETEMSTIQIRSSPKEAKGSDESSSPSKETNWAQGSSGEVDASDPETDEALHEFTVAAAEQEDKEDDGKRQEVSQRSITARSPLEASERKQGEDEDEDFLSALAEAAHEAAESSHQDTVPEASASLPERAEKEEELGPYGKGLVDSIGGLYDAGYLAMTVAVQREIDGLVKGGMTIEQAITSIRPGCERELSEDGHLALATDMRLVRYPREKTFRERVRDLNRKGDRPNLGILPSWEAMKTEVGSMAASAAVRVLSMTWSDPQMIQRVITAMENERARNGQGRLRAEYEWSGMGVGV